MTNYLTYLYLLTPLHTGGSTNEGNLMGIAREVHTEFPYLPASSLRGKIRSEIEQIDSEAAGRLFGQKIKDGQQPTEGEVWFADATLLFFPIASLSHHLVWITCPLWLERLNRWLGKETITPLIQNCSSILKGDKSAVVNFSPEKLYLQTALLNTKDLKQIDFNPLVIQIEKLLQINSLITQIKNKLIVLTEEDCIALVETGLQREVRVALEEETKTVKGGSFRSEETIPPEAVLFFPWGLKPSKKMTTETQLTKEEIEKKAEADKKIRQDTYTMLNQRLQFGGLESLGRGWADLRTKEIIKENR